MLARTPNDEELDAGPRKGGPGAERLCALTGALRRRGDTAVKFIKAFTTAQLDLALGRSNVVHAALLAGPAIDTFLARYARLERFWAGATVASGLGHEPKRGLGREPN